MEVRHYLSLARLYVRKFVFQIDGALLGMASDLSGKLPDFPRIGHYLSPMTGLFRANIMTFPGFGQDAVHARRRPPLLEIGILLGPTGAVIALSEAPTPRG
jgi:hypothetical protein